MPALPAATSFETAFQTSITPEADDIDEMGHVNNVVYLRWAQEIATRHWYSLVTEQQAADWLWVAIRHEVDYRDPILPQDTAEIRTWLGRAKGARFERFVDIRKPGAKRASASVRTDWCLIEATTRRPHRVDASILRMFGLAALES